MNPFNVCKMMHENKGKRARFARLGRLNVVPIGDDTFALLRYIYRDEKDFKKQLTEGPHIRADGTIWARSAWALQPLEGLAGVVTVENYHRASDGVMGVVLAGTNMPHPILAAHGESIRVRNGQVVSYTPGIVFSGHNKRKAASPIAEAIRIVRARAKVTAYKTSDLSALTMPWQKKVEAEIERLRKAAPTTQVYGTNGAVFRVRYCMKQMLDCRDEATKQHWAETALFYAAQRGWGNRENSVVSGINWLSRHRPAILSVLGNDEFQWRQMKPNAPFYGRASVQEDHLGPRSTRQ